MTAALEVRRLSFHFEDGTQALRNVSFQLTAGERVALIGPNGAGKSTILLHTAGILPERGHGEGEVHVLGRSLRKEPEARRHVGLLFQDPEDQLFCGTVGEDVGFAPRELGVRGAELDARVAKALAQVGLSGLERRPPHRLSGGEKKRAALAGLLAYEPAVLALDEPTSALDPRARRQLIAILEELPATLLIATHDLALVAEVCPRTIGIDDGRLFADGLTRDVLRDDELMTAHGLEKPRIDLPDRLLR